MAETTIDSKEPRAEPSALQDTELLNTLRGWFQVDMAHSDEWRAQARRNFDFAAGVEQWKKETASEMEDAGRVPITFNLVMPILKAVAGVEVNTRHATTYLPRNIEEGDIIANEALSDASEWMADGCNAKHQESQAFQDANKCGMGWIEERLDYELDPDGKYIEERISPLEMYWDASARGMNLMDARRVWRARKMTLRDARAMFPDESDDDLNCSWALGLEGGKELKPVEERRLKSGGMHVDDMKTEVVILQIQWWERERYNRVANPFTGELESLDNDGLKALEAKAKEAGAIDGNFYPVESVKQTRRVYKQAFIGGKILKKGACPRKDGFTLHCITGEPNLTKGTWMGLVDAMRDPQMMANKWLSQATHIINSTAKGGILAETDAFEDVREAEATYARPDAITWVKKNAIAQNKIMQKPGVGLAAPYLQLLQFALDALPRVTGINMELLGMRDANQPGILEAQRKQAAMTILATLFDSLHGLRLEVGRTRLHFIQNHLADGRLIRVLNRETANGRTAFRAIRLIKDRVVGDYDVIVDEAPSSPNQKEQTWAALQTIIGAPAIQQMITPPVAVKLLEYIPGIPQQLIDDFREMISQGPSPQEQKAVALQEAGAEAKVIRDQAAAAKDFAQAKETNAQAVLQFAHVTGQQIKNANEQARTVGTIAKVAQDLVPTGDEFAIEPMGGGRELPLPPGVPSGPVNGAGEV